MQGWTVAMYVFFLDFREILHGNRDVLFTYFPETGLLFEGKRVPLRAKTFWFDKELFDADSRAFAEVYAKSLKIKEIAEKLGVESYSTARSSIETYCKVYAGVDIKTLFYTLIPRELVLQYGDALFELSKTIFEDGERPSNYFDLLDEREMVEEIWWRDLVVNGPSLGNKTVNRIMYDPYRSVTGRLNHAPRSFPILSLARERRVCLAPSNDIFVEYDMSSADFRTFLYLFAENAEKWHDKEDLYEDIPGDSRAEKKQKVFQTIYSSTENAFLKRHDVFPKALEKIYKEDDQYVWIRNPFNREIRIDKSKGSIEHLIVSYLIQSTTNDIAIQQALKTREILSGTSSHIAFLIHDCFVVDFKSEDYDRLGVDIRDAIQYTQVGRFYWHELVGENFGTMEDTHGRNKRDEDGGSFIKRAGRGEPDDSSGHAAGRLADDRGASCTATEYEEDSDSGSGSS